MCTALLTLLLHVIHYPQIFKSSEYLLKNANKRNIEDNIPYRLRYQRSVALFTVLLFW